MVDGASCVEQTFVTMITMKLTRLFARVQQEATRRRVGNCVPTSRPSDASHARLETKNAPQNEKRLSKSDDQMLSTNQQPDRSEACIQEG